MDCPKCGAANPDDAEFCGLCLQKFHVVSAPANPSASSPLTSDQQPVSAPAQYDKAPATLSDDPYNRFFEKADTSLESLITGEGEGQV
jgi:hypothetical protein